MTEYEYPLHSHLVLLEESLLLQNSLSTSAFDGTYFQLLYVDIASLMSIHVNWSKPNYFHPKIGVYSPRLLSYRETQTDHHKSKGYKLKFIIDK